MTSTTRVLMVSTDLTQITWLWRWLPLRLSKRQSMSSQTVLLRTTLTRTIILYLMMIWLLGSTIYKNRKLIVTYWFTGWSSSNRNAINSFNPRFHLLSCASLYITIINIDSRLCSKGINNQPVRLGQMAFSVARRTLFRSHYYSCRNEQHQLHELYTSD